MGKILSGFVLALAWLVSMPLSATAAMISFTSTHLGGTQWQFDYEVKASGADPLISELTIFFSHERYANLTVLDSPVGWNSIVVQPDSALASDGFFDTLALGSALSQGMSQDGFKVTFDYLGAGAPGSQRFDVVDPDTFAVLLSGMTSNAVTTPPTGVPEPGTLLLMMGACTVLAASRRLRVAIPQRALRMAG